MPLTRQDIFNAWIATKCGFCGRPKRTREALCNNCYYALPHDFRNSLYQRFGGGYEGTYQAAIEWLTNNTGEKTNVSEN